MHSTPRPFWYFDHGNDFMDVSSPYMLILINNQGHHVDYSQYTTLSSSYDQYDPYRSPPSFEMLGSILRSLRGSNLEIIKFGMYLSFPIGWMYYFGTNLENRFNIPNFWPTQEQSHKLPPSSDALREEVVRLQRRMKESQMERNRLAEQSQND